MQYKSVMQNLGSDPSFSAGIKKTSNIVRGFLFYDISKISTIITQLQKQLEFLPKNLQE